MRYGLLLAVLLLVIDGYAQEKGSQKSGSVVSLIVLGNVQDAGSPHIGCKKDCCKGLFEKPDPSRKVVSLGLVDRLVNKKYLFEATPDITEQVKLLKNFLPGNNQEMPDGIFLTHAHIGHYAGLMYLGKEATDAKNVPVYVMPGMDSFLRKNGPWEQLVTRENIRLFPIRNNEPVALTGNISATPFKVPHRDEYSETAGYIISGPQKKALFIPDIDKWEKWERDIVNEIKKVDYAFIDATFFSSAEVNNRDISQIPHPLVIESMKKFEHLPALEKNKIYFIHFNHTNPLLNSSSRERQEVLKKGFHIAGFKDQFEL